MILFYVIAALTNLYFGGTGTYTILANISNQQNYGTGSLGWNLVLSGLPLILGIIYTILLFRPKNKAGNTSAILNTVFIAIFALLTFVGNKAGEGGMGILVLLFILVPIFSIASLVLAVIALHLKRSTFYILIFLLIIFILAGFFYKGPQNDEQLYSLAQRDNDEKQCEKITDNEKKNECYFYVANKKEDITLCNSISTDDINFVHDQCVEGLISNNADYRTIANCNLLRKEGGNYNCYIGIAQSEKDISICKMIPVDFGIDKERPNLSPRSYCIHRLAVDTKQAQLCNEIVNQSAKNECFNSVN